MIRGGKTAGKTVSDLTAHTGAVGIYAALTFLFVDHGVSIIDHLSGQGSDPFAFVWFFAWLPYAVANHINPFYTHLLWRPLGVSLAWVTAVPALTALLAPVTLSAGPVVAYNLTILAAPVCSAWAAFFLCWTLTRRYLAALIGGYLFGFSSYVMAQDTAAPNLSFAICPPLLALVALARVRGHLSRAACIILATLSLAIQFFMSIEVAALSLLFGSIAWALAWMYRADLRADLLGLVVDVVVIGALLLFLLSPVLLQMLQTRNMVRLPYPWHLYFTADLLNVFIPSRENLLGSLWPFARPTFNGGVQEQDAYLGLPLLGIIIAFARSAPQSRWLVTLFALFLIASFGPFLWIGGWFSTLALPWLAFSVLPLLNNALPARFALFVSLAGAVIAALWLANGQPRNYVWGGLAALTLMPALHPWQMIPNSKFFAPGKVQAALGPDPQLLILPFAINGPSSYWQVENHFGFTQTGGYLGYPPAAMQTYAAVPQLFGNQAGPTFARDMATFAIATGTDDVIITPETKPEMTAALATLHWPTRHVDDVTILTVPHG
jgi:hypothetical protein